MKRIAIFVLLLGLLTGCGGTPTEPQASPDDPSGEPSQTAALPAEMPDDFSIRFAFWVVEDTPNLYDTGAGILQKDMVDPEGQPTIEVPLTVPDETLAAIYDKARDCGLDQLDIVMTSQNLTTNGTTFAMEPLTTYEITMTANGQTFTVKGDETAMSYRDDPRAAAFCDFIDYMKDLYYNSPEYQSLPEIKGGYA